MPSKNNVLTTGGIKFIVFETNTTEKSLNIHCELLPECKWKDPLLASIYACIIEMHEVQNGEMEFFVKDKYIAVKK